MFKDLNKTAQKIVNLCMLIAAGKRQGPEGYKSDNECFNDIECESRDGFIPAPYNQGGLVYQNFCFLSDYYSGGYQPAHEKARNRIKELTDATILENEDSENAYESLSDEHSTVMHELRFMYNGVKKGVHKASISAAINLEAPYHRSSISWAPGVFCEGAKEVEITWKNNKELKTKLTKALQTVSKAIF